jgi:isoleucyl-tRNA synthetase
MGRPSPCSFLNPLRLDMGVSAATKPSQEGNAAAGPLPVPKRYVPDEMERRVLARWEAQGTFRRQVEAGRRRHDEDPAGGHKFVFLEGPPTANGLPHPGHVLTRTLKDSVNRWHAMQGKWVPRKAGWDCHGLPVEIEVQKELGLTHVDDIGTKISVEEFNRRCRQSVFRYKRDWEEMSRRVGFWLDYDHPYVTMDDAYIESVWWSLKRLFEQGLLAKAHKVVPYCPQTGTSYSSHEVALGYKDVVDTSVYVKFRLEGEAASILSWTTTPWTLPGNVALAVGADVDYVEVEVKAPGAQAHAREGEHLILAEALVKKALRNHVEVVRKMKGRDLVGRKYRPLFSGAIPSEALAKAGKSFEVVEAGFVTTEDGTGVVHTAVMYGEDDYQLGMREGLPARHTVGLDGNFLPHVPGGVAGKYVKAPETEAAILEHLRGGDLLYREEKYEHSYPHCWRTGHPLLYYAMDSWYIRMSTLRDQLIANNQAIHWVPDTIQEGRMGDWLRNVKDWAFSRSRFWGTPLPVWVCTKCKAQTCIGSRSELAAHGIHALELHRPYVDQPIDCPQCKGKKTALREPYVIDVWYDSGAAQFAQWSTTDLATKDLREQWPIDFIAEGLDQTRGWFYSLLAAATALGQAPDAKAAGLFQGPAYRNCVVNGLILAEDGRKMSKSLRNYVPPDQVFASQGADATRWYLLSTTAPWQDKRFYEEAVRETFGKFFSTLWNTFLFQHQYAGLDHWRPEQALPPREWSDLDRWLHSRLQACIAEVRFEADRFHLHKATRAIEAFVVDDLSNWWVRRSRDRFWADRSTPDKRSAHSALWTALHAVCRLAAPFAPFMVEAIWSHLRLPQDPDSVHLALLPEAGEREEALEREMTQVRSLAEAGRALRDKVRIPARHPLGRAVLVGASLGRFATILQDELNVKSLESAHDAKALKSYVAKPNRAALGKAFKKFAGPIADAIEALDGDHAHALLQSGKTVGVNVGGQEHVLGPDHVTFEEKDRPGWATTRVDDVVLALHVVRDERLLAEALAREVIRRIQDTRRELDLPLDEEIDVTLACGPEEEARLSMFLHVLKADVRGRSVSFGAAGRGAREWDIDGAKVAATIVPTKTVRPAAVEAA